MTAALIIEPRERTASRRFAVKTAPAVVKQPALSLVTEGEPSTIALAREGDKGALGALLDGATTAVYAYAFAETRKSREAERVTDIVVARLPRVLRRQRWTSVQELQGALMSIARAEVATYRRRLARSRERRQLRAWTRHAVLAASALSTIIYAGVLAF